MLNINENIYEKTNYPEPVMSTVEPNIFYLIGYSVVVLAGIILAGFILTWLKDLFS